MTLQMGLTISLALFSLLLTALGTLIWTRDKERREELAKLRDRQDKMAESWPHRFVLKDDYVRAMVSFERVQQRTLEVVSEMRDKLLGHLANDHQESQEAREA